MPRFVIAGLGRSGTSILGQLLSQHPAVEYHFEKLGQRLASQAGCPEIGRLAPQVGMRLPRPPKTRRVILDKEPRLAGRLGFAMTALPEAGFIYPLRNLLDVTESALRAFGHEDRGRRIQLLRHWGAGDLAPLPPRVALCGVIHHVLLLDLMDLQHFAPERVHVVRYEDLLADPVAEATSALGWMGLGMAPAVRALAARVNDDPHDHVCPHSAGNHRPGHARRIDRWRDQWPAQEAAMIWDGPVGETLRQLGYAP